LIFATNPLLLNANRTIEDPRLALMLLLSLEQHELAHEPCMNNMKLETIWEEEKLGIIF
jgi:hypothetical protein